MRVNLKKYKKILKFKKKFYFTDFDLITNYGLFSGDANLFKTLTIFDLMQKTSHLKGDIIELGIDKGNTSLLIKKILDIFKINKKLYLLDHFKGLVHYCDKKDNLKSKLFYGKYVTKKKQIISFIDYFKFKKINIINKDATKLMPGFFTNKLFCLAYFDMDLYLPTIKSLRAIDQNIIKGGYIVFDQGDKKLWSEGEAIKDFLKENKKYQYISIDKNRQPDVILKKIRD
jgi:hypothetical protein